MAEANVAGVNRLHTLGSLRLGSTQHNATALPDALDPARAL